jgi:DNA-binding NarL/FixJ family response regulator
MRGEGSTARFGFVTIETGPEVLRTAIEAGADFLVSKPFSAETLHEAIERAFAKTRPEAE